MATETGIVSRAAEQIAWVTTTRSEACEACAARDSCHSLGGGKEMEVEALNPVHARSGDRVVIFFHTASLLKASFLIYVLPILGMLAGAVIGQRIALAHGWPESATSAAAAFAAFALVFALVRAAGNRMARQSAYKPKIIRIIGSADVTGQSSQIDPKPPQAPSSPVARPSEPMGA